MSLSYCPNLRQILSICVLTAMIFHPDVLVAESVGEETTRLEPGSVLRLDAFDSDQAPAFGIDLPGSGILTLDAAAAGPAGNRAEIVLLPESGRWETSGVAVLERSAGHLTAAVYDAGPLVFRVASGDPRSPAVRVKIVTGFTPATVIEDAFLGGAGSGGAIRSRFYAGVLVKVDPEAGAPDPGRRQTAPLRQVLFHQRACAIAAADEADDYADTAACAAPLHPDRPLAGDLANRWHDDSDVFSFVLEEPATVDLTTDGDTDTLGELADDAGRILATDDDGGDHRNFRLTRTLPAGRYFVRVVGAGGAEGPYQLSMASRNR